MGSETGVADEHKGLIPRFLEDIFARVNVSPLPVSRALDELSVVVCNPLVSGTSAESALGSSPGILSVSFLEIYGTGPIGG